MVSEKTSLSLKLISQSLRLTSQQLNFNHFFFNINFSPKLTLLSEKLPLEQFLRYCLESQRRLNLNIKSLYSDKLIMNTVERGGDTLSSIICSFLKPLKNG